MMSIPAPAQALLGTDAVAHVWTRNPDGSPQVSVVWFIAHGDEIWFGTSSDSRKAKNLRHDPNILLSIEDTERNERGFQRHLVIRGTASIEPVNHEVLDRMAEQYRDLAHHPLVDHDLASSVMIRVTIDRISGEGPWAEEDSLQTTA